MSVRCQNCGELPYSVGESGVFCVYCYAKKAFSEIESLKAEIKRKDEALRKFLLMLDDENYFSGEIIEEFSAIAQAALGGGE